MIKNVTKVYLILDWTLGDEPGKLHCTHKSDVMEKL